MFEGKELKEQLQNMIDIAKFMAPEIAKVYKAMYDALIKEGFSEEDFHVGWQNFYDQNIKGTGIGAEQIQFVPILDNLKTYYLNSRVNIFGVNSN